MRPYTTKTASVVLLLAPMHHWAQTPPWQAGIAQVIAKDRSPGSGFVVAIRAGRAYLVTAAHVVEGDPNPAVVFAIDSGRARHPASIRDVEGGDPRGLAVLEIENPPSGLHAIGQGRDYPAVGASVLVTGFPASLGAFTVLPATIASIRGRDLFLTPETAEGFSGSPVLIDGQAVALVYGRESGFGKAVVGAASVQPYLKGLGIEWEPAVPQPPAATELKPGTARTNPGDGLRYVWIPPGEFQMGCSPGDSGCGPDEKPPHRVRLTRGFWLGQTEVTQSAYQTTMGDNPSNFKAEQHPVEGVTWEEAQRYCEAAGGRLPTEAEWEYAARAGTAGARYGNLDAIAWYSANSGSQTHPVKQKQPNSWALYDMLGNVEEWVLDWYEQNYYRTLASPADDPKGPSSGYWLVVRGGSSHNGEISVRVSRRNFHAPSNNGLRCVREVIP